MSNPLTYVPAKVPEDCKFKISPSAFAKFVEKPWQWYRSEITKEDTFDGNTSSVIGTIVHYCAEYAAKGISVDLNDIDEYIDNKEPSEDYDPNEVRLYYKAMAECLVNNYVLKNDMLEVETQHITEIRDKFYVGGTIDRLEGTVQDLMIVDYKTYNSKTKPRAIPSYYRYQLLTYAYILRENGYNPTRIRLVYVNRNIDGGISEKTGKSLKSYPPEVTVLTEEITNGDIEFVSNLLDLCVDTVKTSDKYPELRSVIWHDPRIGKE